jgi:hypothetical protein
MLEMHATDDGQFPVRAINPVSRLWKLEKPSPDKPPDTRSPPDKVGACWNYLQKQRSDARTETERTAAGELTAAFDTGSLRREIPWWNQTTSD